MADNETKWYSVDLYGSSYSTHHVQAKTEEEAYELAKKEQQKDLAEHGKDSSIVEYWLNRWETWPECDTVERGPEPIEPCKECEDRCDGAFPCSVWLACEITPLQRGSG